MSQELPDGVIGWIDQDLNFKVNPAWSLVGPKTVAWRLPVCLADREKQAARVPDGVWPVVPEDVMQHIRVYGEAKAHDRYSELRISDLIYALRRWAAMLAAAPTTEPSMAEQAEGASSVGTPAPWFVVVIDPHGVERLRVPMTGQESREFMAAKGGVPEQRWCDGCDPSNCAGCVRVKKGGA